MDPRKGLCLPPFLLVLLLLGLIQLLLVQLLVETAHLVEAMDIVLRNRPFRERHEAPAFLRFLGLVDLEELSHRLIIRVGHRTLPHEDGEGLGVAVPLLDLAILHAAIPLQAVIAQAFTRLLRHAGPEQPQFRLREVAEFVAHLALLLVRPGLTLHDAAFIDILGQDLGHPVLGSQQLAGRHEERRVSGIHVLILHPGIDGVTAPAVIAIVHHAPLPGLVLIHLSRRSLLLADLKHLTYLAVLVSQSGVQVLQDVKAVVGLVQDLLFQGFFHFFRYKYTDLRFVGASQR